MPVQVIDIVVLGIIAFVLIRRLRGALGTRPGDDIPVRPKPSPQPAAKKEGPKAEPGTIEYVFEEIARIDPAFSPQAFVEASRQAFSKVAASFSQGDKKALEESLTPRLLKSFGQEIDRRLAAEELVELEIVGFEKAEIKKASMDRRRFAEVTVEFLTQQITVTYGNDGAIVSGSPKAVAEVTDIWTFSRDLSDRKSRWLLSATRSPHDRIV